jgi:hypothetical protein
MVLGSVEWRLILAVLQRIEARVTEQSDKLDSVQTVLEAITSGGITLSLQLGGDSEDDSGVSDAVTDGSVQQSP